MSAPTPTVVPLHEDLEACISESRDTGNSKLKKPLSKDMQEINSLIQEVRESTKESQLFAELKLLCRKLSQSGSHVHKTSEFSDYSADLSQ